MKIAGPVPDGDVPPDGRGARAVWRGLFDQARATTGWIKVTVETAAECHSGRSKLYHYGSQEGCRVQVRDKATDDGISMWVRVDPKGARQYE